LLYCKLTSQAISRRYDQPQNSGGNYFWFSLLPTEVYSSWRPSDHAT
jgi:hypothetical protein